MPNPQPLTSRDAENGPTPMVASISMWPTGIVTERPRFPPKTLRSGTYKTFKAVVKKSTLAPALRRTLPMVSGPEISASWCRTSARLSNSSFQAWPDVSHLGGWHGSGVPMAIRGCIFVLALDSATISAPDRQPRCLWPSYLVFARVGVEIEQQRYAELLSRRDHWVLLVEMDFEVAPLHRRHAVGAPYENTLAGWFFRSSYERSLTDRCRQRPIARHSGAGNAGTFGGTRRR